MREEMVRALRRCRWALVVAGGLLLAASSRFAMSPILGIEWDVFDRLDWAMAVLCGVAGVGAVWAYLKAHRLLIRIEECQNLYDLGE